MTNSDDNEFKQIESNLDLQIKAEQINEQHKDKKTTPHEDEENTPIKKIPDTKINDLNKKNGSSYSRCNRSKSRSISSNRSRSDSSKSTQSRSVSSRSSRSSSRSSSSSYRSKKKISKKKIKKKRKYSSSRSRSRSYSRSSRSSYSRSRSFSRSRSSSRSYSSRSHSSSRSRSYSRSVSSRSTRSRSTNRRYRKSKDSSYSSSRSRSRSRKRTPKLTSSARIGSKNSKYNYNPTSAIPFNSSYKSKDRFNLIANRSKNSTFNFYRNDETNLKAKSAILSHLNLNSKAKEDLVKRKLKAKMEKEAAEKLKQDEQKVDDTPVIPITSYQNESDSEEEEEDEDKKIPAKKQKIDTNSDEEEQKEKTKSMLNALTKLTKKKSQNLFNETKKAPIIKAGQLCKSKIEEVPVNKFIGPKLPYYTKQTSEKKEQKEETEGDVQPINFSQDDLAKYDDLLKRSQIYAKYNQVGVVNLGPNGETEIKMVELDKNENKVKNENPIQLQSNELYGLSVPEDVTLKNFENKSEDDNKLTLEVNSEEKIQNDILQHHHSQNLILQQTQLQLPQSLHYIPLQNPLQQIIQFPNSGLNLNMIHANPLNLMQTSGLNLLQQPIMAVQNTGLPLQYITTGQQFIQLRPGLPTLTPQPQFIINSPFYRILPQ